MSGRISFARTLVAAAAVSAILAACSGGGSVPGAGSGAPTGTNATAPTAHHFKAATAADKAQDRPSLASRPVRIDSPVGGTGVGPTGSGYYTLVTSLAVDDNLNFSEWSQNCDPSIFAAPWYWAQDNIGINQPPYPVLSVCTPGRGDNALTPDAPTSAPASTYIIAINIGWFTLGVTPLSGPATEANGSWTFNAITNPVEFQVNNLYAFFVATWTPTSSKSH